MEKLLNEFGKLLELNKSDPTIHEGIIKSCESLRHNYKITIEFKNCPNKNIFRNKIIIDGKIIVEIIEDLKDEIIVKSKIPFKLNKKVTIKDSFNIIDKWIKNLKFVRHGNILCPETYNFIEERLDCTYKLPGIQDLRIFEDAIKYKNTNLNNSQKNAVKKTGNFKIIGPPGTGKTTTILEIIEQCLLKRQKILICGPSNTSIDNLLLPFVKQNLKCGLLRIGDSNKCHPDLYKYNLNFIIKRETEYLNDEIITLNETKIKAYNKGKIQKEKRKIDSELKSALLDKKERYQDIIKTQLEQVEVIFSTLYGALSMPDTVFDIVIVDECCQASDLELFLVILKGKRFILVGDPNQLGPLDDGITTNFYKRLDIDEHYLTEQYRMSAKLISFSNKYFYKNLVTSKRNEEFLFFNESSVLFIDTFDMYYHESEENNSKYNTEELIVIIEYLNYLEKINFMKSIGVIMPYSMQAMKLKEMYINSNLNISINTVDSFQGQERDIIIISLVRSNLDGKIGFMYEIRRMNVALTRCKYGLMIIGNSNTFKRHEFYNDFIEWLYENAFCVDPANFKVLFSE